MQNANFSSMKVAPYSNKHMKVPLSDNMATSSVISYLFDDAVYLKIRETSQYFHTLLLKCLRYQNSDRFCFRLTSHHLERSSKMSHSHLRTDWFHEIALKETHHTKLRSAVNCRKKTASSCKRTVTKIYL